MEFLGLIAGLFLPWLLGVVWLRARWLKAGDIEWTTLLGYGWLAGALATTFVMRALDLLGIPFSFTSIAGALAVLSGLGLWAGDRKASWKWDLAAAWRAMNKWHKVAYGILLALVLVRLVTLGLEIVWRPLFPWDAWSQWATKAHVWYELGRMAPFVSGDVWISGTQPGAYTDLAPHYPPAIPLLQVWMAYSIGRWDDALMNLPWLQCAIALGLAFYGQTRRWQISPVLALMFTYFLLSLPILNTHVALAGYADLFMGAFYSLAAIAFFHWLKSRERWQAVVAILFAIACSFIKQPGVVWMLTFIPALLVAYYPRAGLIGVFAAAGAGFLTFFVLEPKYIGIFGYGVHFIRAPIAWEPFWQNLLVLDNWHLLWYAFAASTILSLPRVFSHSHRSMTVLVMTAFSFLGVVFFFTQAQVWAEDYTTLNRAFLHMVPMLFFYGVLIHLTGIATSLTPDSERNYG